MGIFLDFFFVWLVARSSCEAESSWDNRLLALLATLLERVLLLIMRGNVEFSCKSVLLQISSLSLI
jgi:hypothetical protein